MRAQGHYGLAGENSDYCIFICIQVWVCESLFIRRSIPGFTKHKFYILFTEPSAHWNLLADWAGQVRVLTWGACVLCIKKAIRTGNGMMQPKMTRGGHRTVKNYDVICEPLSLTVWLLQGHEGQRWVSWDEREDGPWLGGGEAGRGLDRLPLPLDGGIVV